MNRWAVYLLAGSVVVARSAIFVFWEQSYFDSNQAVIGLMAKHLVEGRAFPVFMYGQNYMLGVEAWLAAPVFLVAGVSVAALKLPLLAINVLVAFLLLWQLERQTGLSPALAAIAAAFFVLPPPGTAAQLLEASGGIVEPFLYILLLWFTRRRPVWCGLILGIGFLHREFTLYGFVSLLILDAARGDLFTRQQVRRTLILLVSAGAMWLAIQTAGRYGSAMGPHTTVADLRPAHRSNQLFELEERFCFDGQMLPVGLWKVVTVHWPALFGTDKQPLRRLSIESDVTQGMRGAGLLLGVAMLLASVRILAHLARQRRWRSEYDFCAYLVMVGMLSVLGYVVARCGAIDLYRMRYEMLSIAGAVGLAGWYLRIEQSKGLRTAWILLVVSWASVSAAAHGRLWIEYLRHPPVGGKQEIIARLNERRVRFGIAEYRDAYVVTFLTNERIIMRSDRERIREYSKVVDAHRKEATFVTRRGCIGAQEVLPGINFCPP